MIDTLRPIKGYFSIELLDKNGNVIEKFEKQNQIVREVRNILAKKVTGLVPEEGIIDMIVLGTKGTDANGIPRDIPETQKDLYSKAENGHTYAIKFVQNGQGMEAVSIEEDDAGSGTSVTISPINDGVVKYTIIIPEAAANGNDGIGFTECGMYVGGRTANPKMFAMRTFTTRFKDNTSSIKINWTFVF